MLLVLQCIWLSEFLSIPAAFIGGLLYIFTPYRFVELYVRGDIGENLAFVFMPLTLFFIYRMYKNYKSHNYYIVLGSVSLACLILAHNAISLMYLPIILCYFFYLITQTKEKKSMILHLCLFILFGFGLSAFFWIPGLIEGKYTLRNIVTAEGYTKSFVTLPQLFYGAWSYGISGMFTVQLGIVNWIMSLLALVLGYGYWKRKDSSYVMISGLLVFTIIAIFIMLPFSNMIWEKIMLLQNFQFPWRFLAIPVFTTSVLGAFVVSFIVTHLKFLPKKFHALRNGTVFACLFLLVILFFNKDYWHAKGYLYKPDSFFSGIYDGTTDTGESSPIWSVRFMENRFKKPLEVISGTATSTALIRTATKHVYVISAATPAQFRENTVYFPGWEIMVDGMLVNIQYQDPHNRGVMTFFVGKGKHIATVSYGETKLRTLADMITLLTLAMLIVWIARSYMTNVARLEYNKK